MHEKRSERPPSLRIKLDGKQKKRFETLKWKLKGSAEINGESCNLPKLSLKSGSNNLPAMHCALVKRAVLLN